MASLKYEAVYLRELADGFEARRVIGEWIDFYNTERPHSALGEKTPAGAYRGAPPVDMMTSRYAPCPHPHRRNNNGKEIDAKGFWRHERQLEYTLIKPPSCPTNRGHLRFQDEARLGQKNGHARIWAKTGTRPRLPADQRYANAYLFGAICPMGAKGATLMLPFANTRAMQMHLDEISCNVAAKAHGVVLMDRAGWHSADKLKVPKNLTIILLPPRSPS